MKKNDLLSGNEAVARGAIEAGIEFVASYPGTPSTEITEALISLKEKLGYPVHIEWSVNEKVAFEAAYGASIVGLRSLVGTKHLGMNVLSDSLTVAALSGVNGGLVVVCADDTQPYSSQTAIDSRYYSLLSNLPLIEPSTPQEAKDLTKLSFGLSERFMLPFIVRLTQRIAHGYSDVRIGRVCLRKPTKRKFSINSRYILLPSTAFDRKKWLENQMNKLAKNIDCSTFARTIYSSGNKMGIIGVGIGATLAKYVIEKLDVKDVKIFKLLSVNPLPKKRILKFAKSVEKILVLEDGDPIVEERIRNLLFMSKIKKEVRGREDGSIKGIGELTPESLQAVLPLYIKSTKPSTFYSASTSGFCAGCPHMASFYVIKEVKNLWEKRYGEKIIIVGDRGCYNQAAKPPFKCIDVCMNMGSSIGIGYGMSKAGISQPIIAVIGDSTLFHSGIPPLLNALFENTKLCVVILDNECTAMTGGQPNPSSKVSATGEKRNKIFIEDLLRSLGFSYIDVINPFRVEESKNVLLKALNMNGISIVIFRHECALQKKKFETTSRTIYEINKDKCKRCKKCVNATGCEAIKIKGKDVVIDPIICTGCGLCASICQFSAIRGVKSGEK
jgi:indolepyruvate ferredoxin oxidoreductase alpha subunit